MAEFSKLVITNKGQALLAKMIAGSGNIEFTQISASSTAYTTDAQLEELTSLTDVKQTSLISKITRTNEVAIEVEAAFTNTELTEGYHMKALGLYAKDPDEEEILYAVTREISGNCYMPAYNGITVSGAYVQLITTVGNAESVSIEVNQAAVATIKDITDLNNRLTIAEQNIDNLLTTGDTEVLSFLPTPEKIATVPPLSDDELNIYKSGSWKIGEISGRDIIKSNYVIQGNVNSTSNKIYHNLSLGSEHKIISISASSNNFIIVNVGPEFTAPNIPSVDKFMVNIINFLTSSTNYTVAITIISIIDNEE